MPTRHLAEPARAFIDRIPLYTAARLAYAVLVAVALLLTAPAEPLSAQGPGPVGIRAQATPPSRHLAVDRAAMRRRMSPGGKGALIGTIVGLGLGYYGTRSSTRWGGDGGDPLMLTIFMGVIGMGVGALLGYVWGQDGSP